ILLPENQGCLPRESAMNLSFAYFSLRVQRKVRRRERRNLSLAPRKARSAGTHAESQQFRGQDSFALVR
ncbi:hypothetical protein, partial [Stutzerimonas kunmingensis]|uniref:hypothetical protein n=1 Tax=Stutzerimonas kunmingensis TaxID=1211807 RepID=UPI0028A93C92